VGAGAVCEFHMFFGMRMWNLGLRVVGDMVCADGEMGQRYGRVQSVAGRCFVLQVQFRSARCDGSCYLLAVSWLAFSDDKQLCSARDILSKQADLVTLSQCFKLCLRLLSFM
jgi:hypothetical protein